MNTCPANRYARILAVSLSLLLMVGRLAGQASTEAAAASAAAAPAAAGAVTLPGMPSLASPSGAQGPPAPAEGHSIYPHREARIRSASAHPAALETIKLPQSGETLHVIVGRSMFVNTPERLRRVYVSNPLVIESMTPSPNEVVITAKTAGTSSIVLWDEAGESKVFTVMADVDIAGLRESLAQALPADQVNVEVQQDKVFLAGVVGSDAEADIASRLASVYSKDIVNSLVVDPRHRPQVQLKVRFAELDRSKLDAFGINFVGINSQNAGLGSTEQFSPFTFQPGSGNNTIQASDFLNLFYFNFKNGVGASLKDLQTKGILEILAEPTLMTMDGQPARFLAGGEFPFPIVQPGSAGGTATVTVQFRQFGVKLDFTPYVNPDGTIRLKVTPEVSALDYSNVVVIAGYTIPSLSTRRAETEVELRDGQTFGISGILDRRTTDSLNKMPGIGDVPILGQLFRSKSLNHSVMELVVVVTPTIVDPLSSQEPPPPNPNWLVPPGTLGNFDKNLPKSYKDKQ
jgi:pilus assembly protein CpaC